MEPAFYPNENTVNIAVLYERIGNIQQTLADGFKTLNEQNSKEAVIVDDMERRIGIIEKQIQSARWFLTGLGVGSGIIGGVVASAISQLFQ